MKISKKNYFIYGGIVVVTILIVVLINNIIIGFRKEELKNSYISEFVGEVSLKEFNNYISENNDFVVYFGKKNCSECLSFEHDLHKKLKDEEVFNDIIFLDIENKLEEFNKLYNVDINKIPNLLVVKDKKVIDYVKLNDNDLIKFDSAYQLLEINGYLND